MRAAKISGTILRSGKRRNHLAADAHFATKRGGNALEDGSPVQRAPLEDGNNLASAVHALTGNGHIPCYTDPVYADQTAALQLGHFAPKSVLGAHVTRLLVENETDPGLRGTI